MLEKLKTIFSAKGLLTLAAIIIVAVGVSGVAVMALSNQSAKEAHADDNEHIEAKNTPTPTKSQEPTPTAFAAALETIAPQVVTPEAATPNAIDANAQITAAPTNSASKASDQPEDNAPSNPDSDASETQDQVPALAVGINQNMEFPYLIKVNKQQNCITVYGADDNGNYNIPFKAMVCSAGNATPLGEFNTTARYDWKLLKGNVWGQYSTRIVGSILFHSVPYRIRAKDSLIVKYYNKLGTIASAGCIRLTTIDAKWIYDNCPIGTTVIIYNDSDPGPLGKPSSIKITADNGWDPTDPDDANPWYKKALTLDGVREQTAERGQNLNLMAGVSASDRYANDITGSIQVIGSVDYSKCGQYPIRYQVSDNLGNTTAVDAIVTIVDTIAPIITDLGNDNWKKPAEVTRDYLASLVSVSDNGYPIDPHAIEISIPALHDGDNVITYTARDESFNSVILTKIIRCDGTAPVISANPNAAAIISADQELNADYLLQRVTVRDLSPVQTTANYSVQGDVITANYTATDAAGNRSEFMEQFHFNSYTLSVPSSISVDSIQNQDALLSDLTIKDRLGHEYQADSGMVSVSWQQESNNSYRVTYTLQYNAPGGVQTVTASTIAIVN